MAAGIGWVWVALHCAIAANCYGVFFGTAHFVPLRLPRCGGVLVPVPPAWLPRCGMG